MKPNRLSIMAAIAGLALVAGHAATAGAEAYSYIGEWGTQGNGNGQLSFPSGIAIDPAGNLFVSDWANQRIQKFTSSGAYLLQWGSQGTGNGQFNNPGAIAVDGDGNVYVSDEANNRIQKFSNTGAYLDQWGSQGIGNGQFQLVLGIATDPAGAHGSPRVYVADYWLHRIQKFTSTGSYLAQWNALPDGEALWGMTSDPDGNLFVAAEHTVYKFTDTGELITQFGQCCGPAPGEFLYPVAVATNGTGEVFVAERGHHRVQKFTGMGSYITEWGTEGSAPGQFQYPTGVAVGPDGTVYIVDSYNHRVQMFGLSVAGAPMPDRLEPIAIRSVHPNPFRGSTLISLTLAARCEVTLGIWDIAGREVARLVEGQNLEAGVHDIRFDSRGLSSGVYLCRLRAADVVATRRMIVTR